MKHHSFLFIFSELRESEELKTHCVKKSAVRKTSGGSEIRRADIWGNTLKVYFSGSLKVYLTVSLIESKTIIFEAIKYSSILLWSFVSGFV